MQDKLTNTYVDDFLQEYENNSTTCVYEEGTEKAEIIKIAKEKMGIDLINNSDLAGFKTIYTFSDIANGNKGRVPQHLLLQAMPTLIGKPVNINHLRNMVVGYYIDFKYIQSENKMIAYGIFFKSNFAEEWEEAKSLLQNNKLGTSHEIWCPKHFRKNLPDGTYEMQKVEFAGGALIYRNQDNPHNPSQKMQTAYAGCDVLEVAMKKIKNSNVPTDLLFASLNKKTIKYTDEDLIVANENFFQNNELEIQKRVDANEQQQQLTVPKIQCEHCDHIFETLEVGELSCAQCKSIIDRTGKVLFPPQKFDFSFSDPEGGELRLLENSENTAVVKNMDSGKIYRLTFKTSNDSDEFLKHMDFIYVGSASCPQCHHNISISASSRVDILDVECPSCNLRFHKNLQKNKLVKKIVKYEDITEQFKTKIEEEGDKSKMEEPKQELVFANLFEDPMVNLEVANIIDLAKEELATVTLELASLDSKNELVELEVASLLNGDAQDEALTVNLEVANLSPAFDLEVAHSISEASLTINLEVASLLHSEDIEMDLCRKELKSVKSELALLKNNIKLDTASLKSANELEIVKIRNDADQKISFYKDNAVEVTKRRSILGEFANNLSDQKIVDDSVYAQVKLEKENALLKASKISDNTEIIGEGNLSLDGDRMQKLRAEIDKKAFSL